MSFLKRFINNLLDRDEITSINEDGVETRLVRRANVSRHLAEGFLVKEDDSMGDLVLLEREVNDEAYKKDLEDLEEDSRDDLEIAIDNIIGEITATKGEEAELDVITAKENLEAAKIMETEVDQSEVKEEDDQPLQVDPQHCLDQPATDEEKEVEGDGYEIKAFVAIRNIDKKKALGWEIIDAPHPSDLILMGKKGE